MAQRSTTLSLVADTCLRALDHYEAGDPYDRDIFSTGIAAHAVLQVLAGRPSLTGDGIALMADHVVLELSTKGRSFDGVAEPPLPVEACIAGRDLALAWLEQHPIPPGAVAELGMAVNSEWGFVDYADPDAHYKAILDLKYLEVQEDEESAATVVVAEDFKSSWRAREDHLDSIQMKGQAVLAAKAHPEADAVKIVIANLRTRQRYERTIWLDEEGWKVLDGWENDIDLAIAATEFRGPDGKRPASPGAGCLGCPYLSRCEPARAILRGTVLESGPEGVALRYAVAKAMVEELGPRLQDHTAEAPIKIAGGLVGYQPKERREAVDNVEATLAHIWFGVTPEEEYTWDAQNGTTLGLLRALDPGVGSLTGAASALSPRSEPDWKTKRGELIDQLIKTGIGPSFGVHKL